ncbi:MAG TPA: V-type ATPase 116kDa subunit family protein [Actinocrinis sp.]|nr:V-type ATPase 116kDa subunit family protein [Actinocrinis sp.]
MSGSERVAVRWRESLRPVRMQRVSVTAGLDDLREALVTTGLQGCVEIDQGEQAPDAAAQPDRPDPVERYAATAARRAGAAAVVGWCPADDVPRLAARLSEVGAALVPLPRPRGVDPPTLLRDAGPAHRAFSPLVRAYGTVPYADLNPTLLAGLCYVVMFGLMFGDAGHGAMIVACAVVLRSGRITALAGIRHLWPFVAAAGAAAMAVGVLYGECFGPTGIVPALWLKPLDEPLRLLGYAIGLGAVLLAVSYGVGTANRWREAGARAALWAPSGIAGAGLFLGVAVLAVGALTHCGAVQAVGGTLAVLGAAAAAIGLAARAPGGAAGGLQVGIGLFDLVTRIGSNAISFARIAAFGLTHAALSAVVWQGTAGLARHGPAALAGAVVLFALGNAAAFALEGLVVAVQAMRLEYYELFSRIFDAEGRPFRPFRLSARPPEVDS